MKRYGFTLAETLVTLGIIGVVSAITLPILTKNYQKFVVKNQIKKSYNLISNAVNAVATDENFLHGCYYGRDNGISTNNSECLEFFEAITKKLNVKKYCPNKSFQNGCVPAYKEENLSLTEGCGGFKAENIKNICSSAMLNDGTIIILYRKSEKYNSMPIIAIDVNGFRGPNKQGQDIYAFQLKAKYNNFPMIGTDIVSCLTPPNGNLDNFWFTKLSEIMK